MHVSSTVTTDSGLSHLPSVPRSSKRESSRHFIAHLSVIYRVLGLTPLEMTAYVFTRQASLPIASSLKLVTGKIHEMEKTMPGKGEPSQDVAHRKSAQSGVGV